MSRETQAVPNKCTNCGHAFSTHHNSGCRGKDCPCDAWKAPKGWKQPEVKGRWARKADASDKAAMAARLRAQRLPWDEVARRAGFASRGAAYNAVTKHLKAIPREAANELRQIELESLDVAEAALASKIKKGSTYAIDSMLKIKAQRARLTGLYDQQTENGLDDVRDTLKDFLAGARAAVAHVVQQDQEGIDE